MKTKYLFIGIALACVLGACSRDEESLFDKSASERAQEALDNANEILPSPEFGWEMVYFPNPDSKGYNMIVKFEKNGRVSATAKNKETTNDKMMTDSTSTWIVKLDYGPIVSFDTYNDVFHAWADPQGDGDGLLGDYEFLILRADKDRVLLKGKKHSAYCIMRPMKNMSAEDYFAGCASKLNEYFGNGNILTLNQGGNLYYLHNGSTGLFTISEYGKKAPTEDPTEYPLCATLDGFMMCYGFNGAKNERLYTYEGDKFVGEEGCVVNSGNLCLLYTTYIDVNKGWTANLTTSEGAFADAATAFQESLATLTKDTKAKLNSVAITYNDSINFYAGSHLLRIKYEYKNSNKKVNLTADFLIDVNTANNNENIVITYKKPHNATAETWYNQLPELGTLVNTIISSFTLESIDPINPTKGLKMKDDRSTIVLSGSSALK